MNPVKTLLATSCLLALASCATQKVDDLAAKLKIDDLAAKLNVFSPRAATRPATPYSMPADVTLPFKRALIVSMSPRDAARQTRVPETQGHPEYWLEEGKLAMRAATKALGTLFERVTPGNERGASDTVATVRESAGFNPMLGNCTTTVVVAFKTETGVLIAELEAKHSAPGVGEDAVAKAFDGAFQDIVQQFQKNQALVTAFSGASSAPEALRDAPGTAVAPPLAQAPGDARTGDSARARPLPPDAAASPQPKADAAAPAAPRADAEARRASPPAAQATPPQAAKPVTVEIPVRGSLGIFIAADLASRQSYVSGGSSSYWFKEGALLERTSAKTFGRLFEHVMALDEGVARYPLVKLDGGSSYNPTMGTYFARVSVDFFTAAGEPMRTITANAAASGTGESGFEKAYDEAFQDVERQFRQDRVLVAALAQSVSQASATMPVPVADAGSKASGRIALPSNGRLVVYMAPDELEKQVVVAAGFGYASYWFDEGKTIQRTAIRTFGKAFGKVAAGANAGDSDILVTVHGSSVFNPVMKTYTGKAVAIFSSPNGSRLGRFEAEAMVDEHGDSDAAFEKAYEAAFKSIVEQVGRAQQS